MAVRGLRRDQLLTDNDLLGGDTARVTIKFEDGRLVVYPAVDGGPDEVGWRGTYRLLDADTIEAYETAHFVTTVYDFTIRGNVLRMDVISSTDPVDFVPQTSITRRSLHAGAVAAKDPHLMALPV